MLDAIDYAHKLMAPFFEMQIEIQKEIGKKKWEVIRKPVNAELVERVSAAACSRYRSAFAINDKLERAKARGDIATEVLAQLNPQRRFSPWRGN